MTPFERKRLAVGLTQQQIADKFRVSQAAVKKWEKGLTRPRVEFFPKLARVLKITPDEAVALFDGVPEPVTA